MNTTSYVLLQDALDRYFGRVMEMPGVIVQGESPCEIESAITDSARHYLQAAPKIHQQAMTKEGLPRQPIDSAPCTIVEIKGFKVKC